MMEAERISHDGRHDDLKEDMKSFDLSQLAKTVDSFETTKGIKLTRHLADTVYMENDHHTGLHVCLCEFE